ncbi:uncharacterized protein LOC116115049 [Pistacia vera]|uniref:uncharacterized protein LOC116115049 n=1 Tax=Pistacia vera TaxID=55513 RepID=UPI001262DBD2|nr:uncharacterized protein LOC116115049 [Pistacia vera]
MSIDEVKIDMAPEIESHDKKDELTASPPQEQDVRDTTAASSSEIVENETSLIQENADDTRFNEDRKKLYQAILHQSCWNPWDMKTVGISEKEDYPLHVAVKENYSSCLRELVDKMQSDELAIENRSGNTAFFIAAAMGRVEHAELMFEKNEKLTSIRGEKEMLPIHIAAQGGDLVD